MDEETTYSGRITGAAIMILGLFSIAVGIAMLIVASDRLMAFICIGLPCLCLGCMELLSGYATSRSPGTILRTAEVPILSSLV